MSTAGSVYINDTGSVNLQSASTGVTSGVLSILAAEDITSSSSLTASTIILSSTNGSIGVLSPLTASAIVLSSNNGSIGSLSSPVYIDDSFATTVTASAGAIVNITTSGAGTVYLAGNGSLSNTAGTLYNLTAGGDVTLEQSLVLHGANLFISTTGNVNASGFAIDTSSTSGNAGNCNCLWC